MFNLETETKTQYLVRRQPDAITSPVERNRRKRKAGTLKNHVACVAETDSTALLDAHKRRNAAERCADELENPE